MNNLKAKHILIWTLFSMLMPCILVGSILGVASLEHRHDDFVFLTLFFISIPALCSSYLSLLNLFLFNRSLSSVAAKRIATIPLGFSVVCSGILFLFSGFSVFFDGDSEARILFTLGASVIYPFLAIAAIRWFRGKIEKSASEY